MGTGAIRGGARSAPESVNLVHSNKVLRLTNDSYLQDLESALHLIRVVLDFGISLTCSVAALDSYQLEKERPRFFNIGTLGRKKTQATQGQV